ncbi:hypothetical protein QF031_002322 [Pseudarthrobacter defluvii]|uniref:SHOCT domain-containing protein n=1 Tax=Pseudarthrobacter defluvii TaxID=410837 RepID=UPI0027828566|nr:SHOCT domain-containing protein [Pseudarthrobacter defluvii]MDQ0769573.1 hypothetical protein [Pseudarthrobacter defluvii]
MLKLRFATFVLGLLTAAAGAAGGFLLPVAQSCPSAFNYAQEVLTGPNAMAVRTSCRASAQQYAPVWTAVIIVGSVVLLVGIIWILSSRKKATAATGSGAKTEASVQPASARRKAAPRPAPASAAERVRSGPAWPLFLGVAIIAVGIFLGYTVSVGPYCDGAFTSQTSAAGADIANAMHGRTANYSGACRAAAGQQSAIYWGIIGFGAAVIILGLVLRTVLGRRPQVNPSRNVTAELEQLAKLLDRGLLTQDEFNQQKGKLLAQS